MESFNYKNNNNYFKKYLKYKKKYLNYVLKGGEPPSFELLRPLDIQMLLNSDAHKAAYNLLSLLDDIKNTTNTIFQIVTSESLTAGLIFSTLVDIPYGGAYKYGCFGVYDTNAKRIFNRVSVSDVYTHECVKQMAIGALMNSEGTIAIAVSGNAMSDQTNLDSIKKMGEVFIGIAAYSSEKKIIVNTKVVNFCNDSKYSIHNLCKDWIDIIIQENKLKKIPLPGEVAHSIDKLNKGFNDFTLTSIISNCIRLRTVIEACDFCISFIQTNKDKLIIPNFIKNYTTLDSQLIATSNQNAQKIDEVLINKIKGSKYFGFKGPIGLEGPKHFINNIILNERTLQDYTIKCDDNDLCQSNRTNTNSASIAELNSGTFKLPDVL